MISSSPHQDTSAKSGSQNELAGKRRFIPIGLKFAIAVVVMLVSVALVIGIGLSRAARRGLVQAKVVGAEMIVDNVAKALSPALDFGDQAGVTEYSQRLSATRDVSRVVVWDATSKPVFSSPTTTESSASIEDGYRVTRTDVTLTRKLKTPMGEPIGALEVRFSLQPENTSYLRLRRQILVWTGALALAVAGLVVIIARFAIVVRLKQLLRAMAELRLGKNIALDSSTRDEIGELAAGFNEMASTIKDRERHLSIERDKSHELLDNMRQAILVVGRDGRLSDARSRQAEVLFGVGLVGKPISEFLCDPSRPSIERTVVEKWIETAFGLGHDSWPEIAALAPSEAVVTCQDGEKHVLALDVRPIAFDDELVRIMFLCSDVTAQRSLEKTVQQQEIEHDRQMRFMRTLLSGGGMQLVEALRNMEDRLATSRAILARSRLDSDDLNEVFQYVHSIKGDASAFELEELVQAATALEGQLGNHRVEVQHGATLDVAATHRELGCALDVIAAALKRVREMAVAASPYGAEIFNQVMVRRSDLLALHEVCANGDERLRQLSARTLAQPFGALVRALGPACQRWAKKSSKQVAFEVLGHSAIVPYELSQILPLVLTQLVRNAIAHGIESAEERLAAGKAEVGRITLSCSESLEHVEIHVTDDGAGLKRDLVAPSEVSVEEAVFLPGVTTADDSTSSAGIAGCGVGLGLVRSELASVGYTVELQSTPFKGVDVFIHAREPERKP